MTALLLCLTFIVASATFGPDAPLGRWCALALDETVRRLGRLSVAKLIAVAAGLLFFFAVAGAIGAEAAWMLSLDTSFLVEAISAALIAASMVRLRRVRPAAGGAVRRLTLCVARVRTALRVGRRAARPRRSRPNPDDAEGPVASPWAFA